MNSPAILTIAGQQVIPRQEWLSPEIDSVVEASSAGVDGVVTPLSHFGLGADLNSTRQRSIQREPRPGMSNHAEHQPGLRTIEETNLPVHEIAREQVVETHTIEVEVYVGKHSRAGKPSC